MKKFFQFLSLILVVACMSDRKPAETLRIPADSIIPEAQMVLLLADAHTIEAAVLIARNRGTNTKDITTYYYAGLFKKYRISKERYQQNLSYYREGPKTFIKLYEQVNRELIMREKNFVDSRPN
ncbi:MAG: DUF4296 domain-containing protein [Bacteroidales bacterium]|nr:DUF4296 domain-containing protein [Bacteroidales bacterium]